MAAQPSWYLLVSVERWTSDKSSHAVGGHAEKLSGVRTGLAQVPMLAVDGSMGSRALLRLNFQELCTALVHGPRCLAHRVTAR